MRKRFALACSLVAAVAFAVADQWSNVPGTGPSARGGAVMVTVQGVAYLHGGFGAGGALGDLWRWTGSAWEQVIPVGATPSARYLHAGTSDGRYLYVLLGQDASGDYLDDVWRYDPKANQWTELTAAGSGSARSQAAPVVDVARSRATAVVTTQDMEQLPTTARDYKSIVVLGGETGSDPTSDRVLVYNTVRNQWSDAGNMVRGLTDHNTTRLGDGDLLVFNGHSSLGVNDRLWRVSWKRGTPSFIPLGYGTAPAPVGEGAAAFSHGGVAYVAGGWNSVPLNAWWKLDCTGALLQNDACSWGSAGALLPESRWEHGMTYTNSFTRGEPFNALLHGGRNQTYVFQPHTWRYTGAFALDARQVDCALPSVADLTGRGGVKFQSRVEWYNWCDRPLNVDATFIPRTDVGGEGKTGSFTVNPGVLYETESPFLDWWGIPAGTTAVGSVLFDVDGGLPECLFAQSFITAINPDGTEYRQFFPAIPWRSLLHEGQTFRIPMTEDGTRNRVNAGMMGLGGTTITIQPFGSDGLPLGPAEQYDLGLGQNMQLNDLYSRWELDLKGRGYVHFGALKGSGAVYLSELDGRGDYTGTSDPTTRLPTGWGDRLIFPEIGTVQGIDLYRGGLSLLNSGDTQLNVQANFYERAIPGVAASTSFLVPAGGMRVFPDASRDLFSRDAVGTIELYAPNGELIGLGREFAVYADDGGTVTGTAGQRVPGLTGAQKFFPGFEYHYLGLRQTGTGAGSERSHAVFFNPGTMTATATLKLFDGPTGAAEGEKSWTIAPQELKRINFLIQELNPSYDSKTKRIEMSFDHPLYGSAYNVNKDGDPVTLQPFRVP